MSGRQLKCRTLTSAWIETIYRVGAYDVMIISSVDESPYLTLERLSLAEKIAWFPFGIENVQQVEDTRHSNSQHVSYLRIIQ